MDSKCKCFWLYNCKLNVKQTKKYYNVCSQLSVVKLYGVYVLGRMSFQSSLENFLLSDLYHMIKRSWMYYNHVTAMLILSLRKMQDFHNVVGAI